MVILINITRASGRRENPQGGKKMARAKKDDYAEGYILSLALASNKKEKIALINRIYEDGFIDGLEAEK